MQNFWVDQLDIILAGIDERSLLQAVDTAVSMNMNGDNGVPVPDYVEENVSSKVVRLIQSYTGVVDKMVWRKYCYLRCRSQDESFVYRFRVQKRQHRQDSLRPLYRRE